MDTLIHADIFFFVTTIVVIVVGLLLVIALIYIIKILSSIKRVAQEVRDETILFREDVQTLRASVRTEGFKLKSLLMFVKRFIPGFGGSKKKQQKVEINDYKKIKI